MSDAIGYVLHDDSLTAGLIGKTQLQKTAIRFLSLRSRMRLNLANHANMLLVPKCRGCKRTGKLSESGLAPFCRADKALAVIRRKWLSSSINRIMSDDGCALSDLHVLN